MRNIRDWDETDLDNTVQADQKETTTLDYKDSAALDFKSRTPRTSGGGTLGEKHRNDLIRDVAAMANAEGGLIIYGIKERAGGYPDYVDDGVAPTVASAEQIEQIILANINPRVEGFVVHPIDLTSKGLGTRTFVISIPKAGKSAPHQSNDMTYPKRRDATTLAMEDNEIRDMVGRSLEFGRKFGIAWDLQVEVRRIVEAAKARSRINPAVVASRRTFLIAVSSSLRSSGVAVMALPLALRGMAGQLISDVDEYNALVETVDPGQHDHARLTSGMSGLLNRVIDNGNQIIRGLTDVLRDQPQ